MSRVSTLFASALILALGAAAQVNISSLSGTVADPSGSVVPNARVLLRSEQTGVELSVTTAESGSYLFTPLQAGVAHSFDVDMSRELAEYKRRRDFVVGRLSKVTEVAMPGGAFYVFARAPGNDRDAATRFYERCKAEKVFIVPGEAFSARDTHFRLSYATKLENLEKGLETIVRLMK